MKDKKHIKQIKKSSEIRSILCTIHLPERELKKMLVKVPTKRPIFSRACAKISTTKEEEITDEKIPEALKAEEKLESFWYILQSDGKMVTVEDFNFKGHENLQKFAKYEIQKVRTSQLTPPYIFLMKKLEIADYEPGSDLGNVAS